jgi:hypothetical protein
LLAALGVGWASRLADAAKTIDEVLKGAAK